MKHTFCILFTLIFLSISKQAHSTSENYNNDQKISEIIKLAHQGYEDAQYIIGRAVLLNEIKFSNHALAMQWLENSVKNNPNYAFQIGLAYGKDFSNAEVWYLKAADLGVYKAFISLGHLYLGDKNSETDNLKAKIFFENALAHDQIQAYAPLGYIYMKGLGVIPNLTQAENYFHQAIAHKDPLGFYYMGLLEQFHKNAPNIPNAIQYYILAGKNGNPAAAIQIVRTYINDPTLTNMSKDEALFWAFLVSQWGAEIKPETYSLLTKGLSSENIETIRKEAEAQFMDFSLQ